MENPYKSPQEGRRFRSWSLLSAADHAKIIFESLRDSHLPENTYEVVDVENYRHLSQRFYRRTQAEFESMGFRLLGDIEDITLRGVINSRTFIRVMVDRFGTTTAGFWHLKPSLWWRFVMFLMGVPSKTIELQTDTRGQHSYVTTTVPESMEFLEPPWAHRDSVPRNLALNELYERHLQTLSNYEVSDELMSLRSIADVIAGMNVSNRRKFDYLEEIGWSTPEYLLSFGIPEKQLDEVREEILKLRAAMDEPAPEELPSEK